jgi:hypothetical protein
MSYNSQVEKFVVGDLVFFTGYELDSPPLAHQVGLVVDVGAGSKVHKLYEILWLHSGIKISIPGKHLTLAYTRKD